MTLGIGIDTGGTYTDAVIYNFETKAVAAKAKALTTKENLSIGIGNALDALPIHLVRKASVISLSTTLATNACVENKGGRAKLVLLGTSRKVLEWVDSKAVYGLKTDDVLCIDIKSSFDGRTSESPNWERITETEHEWLADAQALAVAGVNALRNGAAGEKAAKEHITAKYPVPFIMATELASELNVMERGATALLNARLLPIIEEFMAAVKTALSERKLDIKEMIVRSDGSLMTDEWALKHPVKTILSGPAASIIGGRGLTDCPDSIIVDMGGTTTDISVVVDNEPAMTDGIHIGGFRTQIKGVFIDTFGLGGDSRIVIKDNALELSARRVQPLCVAAAKWPQIKTELQALLDGNKSATQPLYEFLYLVKTPQSMKPYSDYEAELIEKLKDAPVMLGSGAIDLYNLKSERLEDEGIVMRCGLTPTDIMHIKGDFDRHDSAVSVIGARYLLKVLHSYEDTDDDLRRLCDDIYDMVCAKLYENIVRVLLINKYPKIFEKGIDEQLKTLIRQNWAERGAVGKKFSWIDINTTAALIGIGAPTHIFLPSVAKALGTQCVIPAHAEVANAVGAIIADISVKTKVDVMPEYSLDGITGYMVYYSGGNKAFRELDEAVEFAKATAEELAVSDAKKRGALGELAVDIQVSPNTVYSRQGAAVDMGTTVEANVTGRINTEVIA